MNRGSATVDDLPSMLALRRSLHRENHSAAYIDSQVAQLFESSGFRDRFNYMRNYLTDQNKGHLLVSGSAVGTELKVAVEYGFRKVTGTEVTPSLVEISNQRFEGTMIRTHLYDGIKLPFANDTFTFIASGHIIEHTPSPRGYLIEHMRVLQPAGTMFLEFPNRYHSVELHTGVPSLEWAPYPFREMGMLFLGSRFSPCSDIVRNKYRVILSTLKPVSTFQVRVWLRTARLGRVIHAYSPAPGFTRMILQKVSV